MSLGLLVASKAVEQTKSASDNGAKDASKAKRGLSLGYGLGEGLEHSSLGHSEFNSGFHHSGFGEGLEHSGFEGGFGHSELSEGLKHSEIGEGIHEG